jgi:hypothetical protein
LKSQYPPSNNYPVFQCHTLFIDSCDDEFIYHWLDWTTFPKLERVYLNSSTIELEGLTSVSSIGKIYKVDPRAHEWTITPPSAYITEEEYLRTLESHKSVNSEKE